MSQMIECCKMPLLYHSFLFICGYPRICTIEIIRIQFSFQDKYIPYLSKWFNFILPYAAPDVLLLLYLWCISLLMVESRPELVPVSFLALWFNSLVDTACLFCSDYSFPSLVRRGVYCGSNDWLRGQQHSYGYYYHVVVYCVTLGLIPASDKVTTFACWYPFYSMFLLVLVIL